MSEQNIGIVFHGENAAAFRAGFEDLLEAPGEIVMLPDDLATDA